MKKELKIVVLLITLQLFAYSTKSSAVVLEDFENYSIGTSVPLFNVWGNTAAGSAEVVADPANANNKVLHVTISGWGNFTQVVLPSELQGKRLIENNRYVSFRIRRATNDVNDNKKVQIYQDKALLYEDDGYPHQGDKGVWSQRSYTLPTADATFDYGTGGGKVLALGFNSDASEYYIDDIVVKGEYDDYETIEGTVSKDFTGQNTSSTYKTISTPYYMVEGSHLVLNTARYTYITSPIVGTGRIDINSGGERTYIGGSDKMSPNWSNFKGDIHVYPYTALSSSNGFYGLVWMHNGKTFNLDNVMNDLADGKVNSTLRTSSLTMHAGTTLAAESGTRAIRIGQLNTESGSQIYGYMKEKSANNSFYIIGNNGNDATLAGRISPFKDNISMELGIIKEGLGTYRITGNDNIINGGVRVLRGRVLFNNDASTAKAQRLTGALGTPASAATAGLNIMKDGIAGGTGHIAATTNVYGILQPGDDGVAHLDIADYVNGNNLTLIVRPTARIDCEINSATEYDQVNVAGPVSYYNIDQEFATSEQMPRLRIQLTKDADLHEGDEFVLLTAKSKTSYQNVPWQFTVVYPKAYSWKVVEEETADGYRLIARVTSVIYSGQGDVEDGDDDPGSSTDDGILDIEAEKSNTTPLRYYADKKKTLIGTCVPIYDGRINVDYDTEARPALVAKEFNMVVCENEMKFDATEPSRGNFSFANGDRLVRFAQRHNMYVRGHTLVWYSQNPAWLTTDGNKNTNNFSRDELLSIMKKHIFNVVGHWKGKVKEWDVANEVLSDNQQSIYSNPKAYDLRPSVWSTGIGEEFLDSAFVWAHQADPDAILILNDYGVEGKGWGKSEALFNLAMRLKNDGRPIHGIGLQGHMDAGLAYVNSIEENIKRCKDAGLLCRITELDLGIDNASADNLQKQAENYYSLARIAMRNPNCESLMIWGLSDDLTWRSGRRPLLFDSNLNKKPAYWAVHSALRQAVGEELSGIDDIEGDTDCHKDNALYNLQGQRIKVLTPGQMYILNGRKMISK